MVNRELLLANSLLIFLMHCEEINFEFDDEKPLVKYVEEGKLIEFDVYISLMKWEVHHGLKIDPESYISFSISEIIDRVIDQPELSTDDYMDHLYNRLTEIKEANYIYESAAEEYEKESDMESYLGNIN